MRQSVAVSVSFRPRERSADFCECGAARDDLSREIPAVILEDAEAQIDFLQTQLALPRSLGEQNDLQSAIGQLGES